MEVEVWECQGWGVSVSIRHRLTADSCARRGHGQLTRTRPEPASCVCTCICVCVCVYFNPTNPPPTHTHTYIRLIFHPAVAISFSPSLCLSHSACLPSLSMTSYKSINQFQRAGMRALHLSRAHPACHTC